MDTSTTAPNLGGRPPVLDDAKRQKIIALLANGSSRRVAARYVGCSPLTIARTADRDPDFAAELDRAEINAEVDALRFLRHAARKDRYWRAAAWLLERRNPEDFAPRQPDALTVDQVAQVLIAATHPIVEEMPEEKIERIMQGMEELMAQCRPEPPPAARARPKFPPRLPPPPDLDYDAPECKATPDADPDAPSPSIDSGFDPFHREAAADFRT